MTDRMLVCEGACNAMRVQMFDAKVREHRRKDYDRGVEAAVDDAHVLAAGRRLVHTSHMRLTDTRYQCRTCGAQRAYGTT